jgi:beta-fructofuranosidase
LRIFIDKSVVEVFANEQKYVAIRVFPSLKESVGISLRSQGQESRVKSSDVWQVRSIWDNDEEEESKE